MSSSFCLLAQTEKTDVTQQEDNCCLFVIYKSLKMTGFLIVADWPFICPALWADSIACVI